MEGKKIELLIVDDDHDLCHLLEVFLKRDCSVHIEHTLRSADACLKGINPIIILLDNNLPDGLGIKHIHQMLDFCPNAKIVLMTADLTDRVKERALQEGAVKFLAKPFGLTSLKDILFSICPELRAA